jgi:4-amino-4-deoxychorismate lyase
LKAWVNGVETTAISVYDRGLQYGDGLFETMRMVDGDIKLWPCHLARLQQGCQQLGIPLDVERIEKQLALVRQYATIGVIKLIVTRGETQRGYRVSPGPQPNIICMCSELPTYPAEYYTQGVDVRLCQTQVNCNEQLAGIKHLNRLDNVLARMEWQDEFQEGLMCDDQGHIIEGTMSNIVFLDQESLVTPDLRRSGVAGIMRQRLLDMAEQRGIDTAIRPVELAEVKSFDAALLTNSLIGAWPVKQLDGYAYRVTPLVQSLVQMIQECQN